MKEIDVTQQFDGSGGSIGRSDESRSLDGRVVHAVKTFMELLEQGSAPDPKAFLSRYPEIADQLEPYLDGLLLVENRLAKDIRGVPRTLQQTQASSVWIENDTGPSLTNSNLGDFKILGELGRGGMGIVYEAFQISLGRRVALKVLSLAGGLDPIRLQRFRNEAQAAAQLHHTHIVPVYAVGSDRGVHYYAMQLIEGKSLAHTIEKLVEQRASPARSSQSLSAKRDNEKSSSLPKSDTSVKESGARVDRSKANPSAVTLDQFAVDSTLTASNRSERSRYFRNVARMIFQAAQGLEHAHQYGVIHRDIKPANLMLDPVGNVWITDFGLAQIQSDSNLTQTGDIIGTLRYMSPEQASGGTIVVDHRTDVYSLGITFYELLTLQNAVKAGDYQSALKQVLEVDPPSPRSIDPAIPIELETIVQKAIAKIPSERYASAAALADDIQRWMEDKPILAKPPTFIQLAAKWRRRHSGLVNAAMIFVCFAMVGLALTTWAVIREQGKTSIALEKQVEQSRIAEQSFQQARRAVDTFTQLSELELANRGDLRSLRRDFLETSLDFYRDFIETRSGDPSIAKDLEETSKKVTQMIEDLAVLDSLGPLQWLSSTKVQKELQLNDSQIAKLTTLVKELFADEQIEMNSSGDAQHMNDLASKVTEINSLLNPSQLERLRQIDRQSRLPFTFKSHDVVVRLELTTDQRRDIASIIEQERPDLAMRKQMAMGPQGRPGPPGQNEFGPPGGEAFSRDGSSPMRQRLLNDLNREANKPTEKGTQGFPGPEEEFDPFEEGPPDRPFDGPPGGPGFGRPREGGPGFGGPGFGGPGFGGPREGGPGFGGPRERRPGFGGPGFGGPREGRPRPGELGPGSEEPEMRPEEGVAGPGMGGGPGDGPSILGDLLGFGRGPGPGRNRMDALVAAQTEKTVSRIVALFTENQKKTWDEMIGKPFFAAAK